MLRFAYSLYRHHREWYKRMSRFSVFKKRIDIKTMVNHPDLKHRRRMQCAEWRLSCSENWPRPCIFPFRANLRSWVDEPATSSLPPTSLGSTLFCMSDSLQSFGSHPSFWGFYPRKCASQACLKCPSWLLLVTPKCSSSLPNCPIYLRTQIAMLLTSRNGYNYKSPPSSFSNDFSKRSIQPLCAIPAPSANRDLQVDNLWISIGASRPTSSRGLHLVCRWPCGENGRGALAEM